MVPPIPPHPRPSHPVPGAAAPIPGSRTCLQQPGHPLPSPACSGPSMGGGRVGSKDKSPLAAVSFLVLSCPLVLIPMLPGVLRLCRGHCAIPVQAGTLSQQQGPWSGSDASKSTILAQWDARRSHGSVLSPVLGVITASTSSRQMELTGNASISLLCIALPVYPAGKPALVHGTMSGPISG